MKSILIAFLCIVTYSTSAQKLENCSECATKKYSNANISENELYEIELLRNEIFARHQYSFDDERLRDYYSKFTWYEPENKNVSLNAIEQHNIDLFKSTEATIKKSRTQLVATLEKLKSAVKQHDNESIKTVFNNVITKEDSEFYDAIVVALDDVLSSINLKNMNWHKGQAIYKITVDNGFSISTKEISIRGNSITIMLTEPASHTELMKNNDAFEYPSNYYSESESTIGAVFEFKNDKLLLIQPIAAG